MAAQLTRQQRIALGVLSGIAWRTPGALADCLNLYGFDTGKQGAASTASSLVRRGFVDRERRRGLVFYRANDAGRRYLNGGSSSADLLDGAE